jgi:hypothetical protein
MSVRITTRTTMIPDTVDGVITDPSWIARCDQARSQLRRTTLWTYGDSTRAARMSIEPAVTR